MSTTFNADVLPQAMRDARRWLVWRTVRDGSRVRKIPHYSDGAVRGKGIELDSQDDTARLVNFEDACKALRTGRYSGLGFALGPDGDATWQGVDFDHVSAHPELPPLLEQLPSGYYVERSPSGDGLHIIGRGAPFDGLGSNSSCIEAYAGGRYFTVTSLDGRMVGDTLRDISGWVRDTLAPLHRAQQRPATTTAATLPKGRPDELERLITLDRVTDKTLESVASAMAVFTEQDSDEYAKWVTVGMALKSLEQTRCDSTIAPRELWINFSALSEKFDPDEAERKWDSFDPTKLTYRTILKLAAERGWVNHGDVAVNSPLRGEAGFAFVQAGELVAAPRPTEYLIDGLIETGSMGLLFAPPGVGKSFVAIAWSASIATGRHWLERDTKQGSVFFLAGEGHAGIARRLRAWELHTGQSLASAPLFVSKEPAALMDAASAASVAREIEMLCLAHGAPALIVIDTFARNMGNGDENKNADVGLFVNRIDHMRNRLGCGVLLVHHSGHMESQRARGGSSLPAAMDSIYRLDAKPGALQLVHVKSKESELSEPLALALESVHLPDWLDAKGRTMCSAVVVAGQHDSSTATTDKPLTERQQEAWTAYMRAAELHGRLNEAGEFVGVHREHWRTEFYAGCPGDSQEAKQKAFVRAMRDLVNIERLTVTNDVYMLAGLHDWTYSPQIQRAIAVRLTAPGHGHDPDIVRTLSGATTPTARTDTDTPLEGCPGVRLGVEAKT